MPDAPMAPQGVSIRVCRSARLSLPAYHFYRDVLLAFVAREAPPDGAQLQRMADQHGVSLEATLAGMAVADLLQRDPATGAVTAAYPFSGRPTAHRVALFADSSGERTDAIEARVYAMCALDALGILFMLGRAGVVTSEDALTGAPVMVVMRPYPQEPAFDGARPIPLAAWQATWQPSEMVVVARPEEHEAEHEAGTCIAAGACCPITNFFSDRRQAASWMARHSSGDGQVLPQAEALRRAYALFAGVLDREHNEEGGQHAADH